ncbi:PQQ-dependent sugar dehydrogenase [Pedobacter sp. MW01-1-1]|uniref:PQQ-dependent sugar dehydrogenase n=1 Tax=Pedobacter sp. MW01-1-1 TaxID=3383027 RepID=UPI003FEEC21B
MLVNPFNFNRLNIFVAAFVMNCFGISCVNAQNNAPVETGKPTADFKPAFEGQTRVPGVKTVTPIDVRVLYDKLENPWGIAVLPDGRFLISQKYGTMVILNADGTLNKKITGLPKVDPSGQGGLLDVTIDPNFASNGMVYWAFAEPHGEDAMLAIAKGKLSKEESRIENQAVIYRTGQAYSGKLQYGARIVFDKGGNLFVSTGERSGKDIRMQAQNLNSALGKVIHLTPDGKAVPNGPFAQTPNAKPEIYSYGHRNPDGLAFNPLTGDLWEAEFGPKGGDEVNLIQAGKNYGWPIITYGTEYSGKKVGDGIQQKEGMEQPVYYWNPVVSPGCMIFYEGDAIAEWKGNMFVGGLSGSHIARLVIKDNKVIGEERLLAGKGERFRDMAEGKDGALYVVTDNGKLFKLAKK